VAKIYTKTGDRGKTGLIDGSRLWKDHPRVTAYGEIDELNALIGVARAHSKEAALRELLHRIQKDLFALGAQLADPKERIGTRKHKAALSDSQIEQLESEIDVREAEMPPLRTFLLPGGSPVGSFLHLARAVCRRAERATVGLSRRQGVDPRILVYLNRLSDLLFVLARHQNRSAGEVEDPW